MSEESLGKLTECKKMCELCFWSKASQILSLAHSSHIRALELVPAGDNLAWCL